MFPAVSEHTVQNSKQQKKTDKIFKIKKKKEKRWQKFKMADIVMDYTKKFGCPLYTCNTKEACFVRLRGPHTFGPPICLDAPCMFGCPHMFGWAPCMFGCFKIKKKNRMAEIEYPLYVWMPPHVWMGPCMFGCFTIKKKDGRYSSGLYKKNVVPPYVWMPPVHTLQKESMLCQTKGVSICLPTFGPSICLDAPCMFGCPICLPVCLDTPIC